MCGGSRGGGSHSPTARACRAPRCGGAYAALGSQPGWRPAPPVSSEGSTASPGHDPSEHVMRALLILLQRAHRKVCVRPQGLLRPRGAGEELPGERQRYLNASLIFQEKPKPSAGQSVPPDRPQRLPLPPSCLCGQLAVTIHQRLPAATDRGPVTTGTPPSSQCPVGWMLSMAEAPDGQATRPAPSPARQLLPQHLQGPRWAGLSGPQTRSPQRAGPVNSLC